MKKFIIITCVMFFLVSCSSKSTTDENQSYQNISELTEEQDQAIADSLSMELENARMELEQETKENLSEIDSLLENF